MLEINNGVDMTLDVHPSLLTYSYPNQEMLSHPKPVKSWTILLVF